MQGIALVLGVGLTLLASRIRHHSPKPDRCQIGVKGDPMKARIVLVFVLLAAVSLSAQTFRGTILGTVTDPQGAVVAGAKVTVKNVGTGLERTSETSADGSYSLRELPDRHLHGDGHSYRLPDRCNHRRGSGRVWGAPRGCGDEAGPSVNQGGSCRRPVASGGNDLRRTGRNSDRRYDRGPSRQRARLSEANLFEPRHRRLSRSDFGLSGFLRSFLDERFARPVEQLPARRHRYERWLP